MKATHDLNSAERPKLLAGSWATLAAIALFALILYTLSLPTLQVRAVSWGLAVCIGVLPGAALVLFVLTIRALRGPATLADTPEAQPRPTVTPTAAPKPPVLYSLDSALGMEQVQELRAHVDLLCTMATLERMGSDLPQRLRAWGIPARAQQAAVAAEVLQRLLSVPGMEPVLHRCALPPGSRAFNQVQLDLQAIAASLHLLARQVQGDAIHGAAVQGEIESLSALIGSMAPVDRLLVQYAQLLTSVAAMARIIATSYELLRDRRFSVSGKGESMLDGPSVEAALADAVGLPRWKLN
ncbi:MAG TPA: hypothetical protein VF678_10265 [bacterium]